MRASLKHTHTHTGQVCHQETVQEERQDSGEAVTQIGGERERKKKRKLIEDLARVGEERMPLCVWMVPCEI